MSEEEMILAEEAKIEAQEEDIADLDEYNGMMNEVKFFIIFKISESRVRVTVNS